MSIINFSYNFYKDRYTCFLTAYYFSLITKLCLTMSKNKPFKHSLNFTSSAIIVNLLQIQEWPWNFGIDKSDSSLSTKWNIGIWENPEGTFIESSMITCFIWFNLSIFIYLIFPSNIYWKWILDIFLSRVTEEPSWMIHSSEITLRIC
jgi:hypothetical protein